MFPSAVDGRHVPGRTVNEAPDNAISVSQLIKRFGDVLAVDHVDLDVPAGTVLALLGPNGAGKTTVVRMISTLIKPTSGSITVAGIDGVSNPHDARSRMGVSGQNVAVDDMLTGLEQLTMVARLAGFNRAAAKRRAAELLDQFDIAHAGKRRVGSYSGGTRRRLDLAGAIVAKPPVVILDEPTAGLDPVSRTVLWKAVRDLTNDGTSVLLTTQYLEEADQLADQVTVLLRGKVAARGTPDELKQSVGSSVVRLTLADVGAADRAVGVMASAGVTDAVVDGGVVSFSAQEGSSAMATMIATLTGEGVAIVDASVQTPTLDDVFVSLTEER
ncbi:ATP-binding cassette domain-containing protein [Williamsia muralis]|uniref:ATP-binding cassette domain-containing protein n=1 Tax=Williamsia marianensis TaxID=85044 RepID=UPI0003D305CC|nr:ATP-binding cassette domain-containing protein [Williamsia marianensis]ETD30526.1 ABC transporter [Williamsia sp. D3]PVY26685.1 ABC-2 type transport system ATP-binding protein [Williamsia marianensis]